eukprot:FR738525.1.p1 GENE.FR738525.1~~FR738525.1.p1  ORF type:complete len:279 (+),score=22.44 FR738525.1:57-839(+)
MDIGYYDNDEAYWEGINIVKQKVETNHVMATYMKYSCEMNDDDYVYMNHSYCHGDIHVYNDYKKMLDTDDTYEGDLGAYMALKQCGFSATGENHNMSWFVPCMWDTIAHMDDYCSSSGYNVSGDYMSESSRNEGVNHTYFILNMTKTSVGHKFDGCNLHAFCHACMEDDGSLNDNCKSYVELHNNLDISGSDHFFKEAGSYWCNSSTLTDIHNNETLTYEGETIHIRSPGHSGDRAPSDDAHSTDDPLYTKSTDDARDFA